MKKLSLLLLLSIFIVSCASEDKTLEFTADNLIGTWKLVEAYADPGDGSGTYQPVTNGYTFTLNSDGTFTSERISECESGTYSIQENAKLVFQFDCENYSEIFVDTAKFDGSKLVTSPLSPIVCTDGCGNKFKKIK
ncbi:lipocalin family protein [Jejudonia soesokkakensis]|uniref:Lipocalin family protein n=1 Tax=Jejudonia soesokkakensis TaxID=1323432 RepID=A0ABW2MUC7_9FLAO